MFVKSIMFRRLSIFFVVLSLLGCSSTGSKQKNAKTIVSLEIGDLVVDTSWKWNFLRGYGYTPFDNEVIQSVTWIVVAKDHYGPGVTLLSKDLVAYYYFDGSMLKNGLPAGQNHWGNSGSTSSFGLRPWLNSQAPHATEGFYNAFSAQFKTAVLTTTVENKDYADGKSYTTQDKVFIPSNTELGDVKLDSTYEIGTVYKYFDGKNSNALITNFPKQSYGEEYWTRSPLSLGYRVEGVVTDSGWFVNNFADFNNVGVRPVVNVANTTLISEKPNADGVYEISYAK